MASLRIALFAGIQATLDGKQVTGFESAHVRALLAYLAVESKQPHNREKLAGLLWPAQDETRAHQRLSQALYNLRQVLGEQKKKGELITQSEPGRNQPFLLVSPETIQFNPQSDYWLDTQAFSELYKGEKGHSHRMKESCPVCTGQLAEAIEIYHGDFMEGFSLHGAAGLDEWILLWRERLRLQAINALRILSQYQEGLGELEKALELARQQVAMDPLGDSAHRQLMRLLALNGELTAALVLYNNFNRHLQKEMGITPEYDTQALYERLRLEAEAGVALGNLPASIAPLIGRRNELAELCAMLRDPDFRLINLLGPGGSGKTHLALEAARTVRYRFANGVYLISLSALESSQSIQPVVAETLGFSFQDRVDPHQQLNNYLHQKNILLVMDGFEAILPSASWLIEVLQAAPQVRFLVTSRSRLHIKDEQLFPVAGMYYPVGGEVTDTTRYDAVRLFEQSARRVKPDFTLHPKNMSAVIKICQQVEGMPLGILLASAWIELFTPTEIAQEITKGLDFLSSDWNDVPERQRSLKATFDYSWNLLSVEERELFKTLSIFHGNFSIQAIKEIAGSSIRLLQSLVDKSLVNRNPNGRYQIHDLVHQFAIEKLEQDPELARRVYTSHSRYYLQALHQWGKELKSFHQSDTLKAMEFDVENLRSAWRWAVETEDWPAIAGGLVGMAWYADLCFRFQEGERACRIALETDPSQLSISLSSKLTTWRSHFLRRMEQADLAEELLLNEFERLEKLQKCGDEVNAERAKVLYELGELYLHTNRERAKTYYQQSLEICRGIGDDESIGEVLLRLGEVVHHAGEYSLAAQYLSRALPLLQAVGEPHQLASNLRWLGFTEIRQGRLDEGENYIRQAIEVRKQIGDFSEAAQSQDDYATVLAWRGRYQEAVQLLEQCLPVYEERGMHAKVAWSLAILGLFHDNIGKYEAARQIGLRCVQFSSQMNFPRELALGYACLGMADLAERRLLEAHKHLLNALEVERSIPQSDELAFTLGNLSVAEFALGLANPGRLHLIEALEIILNTHGMFSAYICLPACAVGLSKSGRLEKALEVQAMMVRYPAIANSSYYEDVCWRQFAALIENIPTEVLQITKDKGKNRDLFTTAEELMNEFSLEVEPTRAG